MGDEGLNRFVVSVRKHGDDGEPIARGMRRDGLVALRWPR